MMRHLIIFTRAPQLGRVKRRLASEIGALAALRFHRAMLARLVRGIGGDKRWQCWLAVTPDHLAGNGFFSGKGLGLLKQGRGDVGSRMAHCFRALPPGPAVLVGSDIPGIEAAHIARAFAALGRNAAVFGPASDGGYWLVGLKRQRPIGGPYGKNLFCGVRWSSPHALDDTVKMLGKMQGPAARAAMIDMLSDVDTAADYHHWRRLCSSRRGMISTKLQGLNL